MPYAPVQARPQPHTTLPTPPGSATVLPATQSLRPALLPRVTGRWLARGIPPTLIAPPATAGKEYGSAGKAPDLLRVVAWPLAPSAHLPRAARPPFHTDGRNPTGLWSDQSSRGGPWPARHTYGPVPTARLQRSSCI